MESAFPLIRTKINELVELFGRMCGDFILETDHEINPQKLGSRGIVQVPSFSEYQVCRFTNPKQGAVFEGLNFPFRFPNLLSLSLKGTLRKIDGFLTARTNVFPVELI